ncbi:MAG: hypothetical protein JXX28_15435 [Deltaproteobacteria bacterium]|nr:hypothetical protein [Deltaproteobacteria bacterium]
MYFPVAELLVSLLFAVPVWLVLFAGLIGAGLLTTRDRAAAGLLAGSLVALLLVQVLGVAWPMLGTRFLDFDLYSTLHTPIRFGLLLGRLLGVAALVGAAFAGRVGGEVA